MIKFRTTTSCLAILLIVVQMTSTMFYTLVNLRLDFTETDVQLTIDTYFAEDPESEEDRSEEHMTAIVKLLGKPSTKDLLTSSKKLISEEEGPQEPLLSESGYDPLFQGENTFFEVTKKKKKKIF
jgi:hypothetical protein